MKKGKGKIVAVVAGLSVVGLALLAMAFWRDIAVQFYLYRLQSNPDYLVTALHTPHGSSTDVAIAKYLQTLDGKKHFFNLYLDAFADILREQASEHAGGSVSGALGILQESYFCELRTPSIVSGTSSGLRTVKQGSFLRAASPFLSHLSGATFHSTTFPQFLFTVQRADTTCERIRYYPRFSAGKIRGGISMSLDSNKAQIPPDQTSDDKDILRNDYVLFLQPDSQ